jgi:hypothetical protein
MTVPNAGLRLGPRQWVRLEDASLFLPIRPKKGHLPLLLKVGSIRLQLIHSQQLSGSIKVYLNRLSTRGVHRRNFGLAIA